MARRRLRLALVLVVVVMAAVGALARSDATARFLVTEDPLSTADAVVVLAGDPGYERTATAARLVLAGQARLLVLTGGQPGPGDSAASLRERAVALGVPLDRIRLEATSHSTREAMLAVAPLLRAEGARSVIVVTSPYHQRRAAAAARRAWPGIAVRSRPASPAAWRPQGWWSDGASRRVVIGEYLKIAYYWARGWI
ncbi:MAG: hypothetical protein DMF78_10555 [Acidobacteria bacterium]|nr:MAG: hypothetical protein DMF78_10555 [Acidobacteriota bacterium]